MAEASLDAFKAKDTRFVADWLKSNLERLAQALLSLALYLKVFKNCLYYLRHVRVLSSKPCLLERFPGVGAFKCPGGCPGGFLRSVHTMGLVPATSPCNKSQGLVASCELAIFATKSSRRDQNLVPATSPTNSNWFEFVGLVAGT